MARKFKITEEQYKALCEDFSNNPNSKGFTIAVQNENGNDVPAMKKALQNVADAGAGNKVDGIVKVPNPQKGTLNNSRIITKKDLIENRKRKLKESSTLYQFSDFLRK